MPKAVKGTVAAVLLFTIIYGLAALNQQAVLTLPAGTMYILFLYALIGCLGMVVVLPLLFLKKEKKD
ncbi:hypothetical protein BSNK01_17720 [Bacillaceae bacterium]